VLATFDSHWHPAAATRQQSTVLDMVVAQAAQTPDAVAADHDGCLLTYQKLLERSAAVASRLDAEGVGPGAIVGFLGGRSLDTLVGLLGILRTGAAYLPLDPGQPPERLAFIVRDAGIQTVVTSGASPSVLEGLLPRVVPVETRLAGADANFSWPGPVVAPSDPAYVIYTSGSTGKPKGVVVHHGALGNFLRSMRREPGISAGDRVAAITTISFDIAGLEMWLPLTAGARVIIVPAGVERDGVRLAALLELQQVTILQATPATWRLLLDAGWQGKRDLKALCGGEALTCALADRLLPRCRSLWNMYGPTETTVWSTVHPVEPAQELVPIGRPIDNTSVHVLDENLRPVAPGTEGELFIGGDGVAVGYLHRPDLTAARFLPDRFRRDPRARLYRTGDRVRQLPDGSLVYLGRLDDQVKIRGFRIEPGEVESALAEDPSISAAAVVPSTDDTGSTRLVAYVVPRPGHAVASREIRERLRVRLPDYMIPSRVVGLAALPLSPTGKVDRRALPAPGNDGDESYVPPRTATEAVLARLWGEVLGVPRVGITDDFGDLGGDSLQAVQLFAVIAREVGVELPVATLLEAPNIERLARLIEGPGGSGWGALVPIRARGEGPRLFFVHGGGGTVLFLRDVAAALPPHVSLYGLQSEGQDGRAMTGWRVEQMADRYIEAIRAVHPAGPYLLAGYCFGGLVAFEMARRLTASGEPVALLALVNAPNHNPLSHASGSERPATAGRGKVVGRLARRVAAAVAEGHPARALRDGLAWRLDTLRANPRLRERLGWLAHLILASGVRLPAQWRPAYIAGMTMRAERLYRPVPYEGTLTLFGGAGLSLDPLYGWGGLAARIEAHEIGGRQRLRRELITLPLVTALGEQLAQAIEVAQPAP